ncbi:hypothetical protein [Tenuibacillus multivorans]|uniref:Uncharacterized protein n=1 Tax=Tenuibacillus multivorans TaxID=237069 RepID=A0A1H0B988_9BACI|nr:hypothetical protein [Tenuibacillus multivorans]GEL78595.1 hypothetical protein TMU01_28300 [Tenuibacillus multivorans]SDN42172.1 hypothetical protein SAMN05216498_2269 [Tenuibacillus multivorans]
MGDKKIACYRCDKEIKDKTDLVVANKFKLKPFHKKCFNKHIDEKRQRGTMFYDPLPVNSKRGTTMALVFVFLILLFTFVIKVNYLAYFLCFIYPFYRLMSWAMFEAKLS